MERLFIICLSSYFIHLGYSLPHNWRYSHPSYRSYNNKRWGYNSYRHYNGQRWSYTPYSYHHKVNTKVFENEFKAAEPGMNISYQLYMQEH